MISLLCRYCNIEIEVQGPTQGIKCPDCDRPIAEKPKAIILYAFFNKNIEGVE